MSMVETVARAIHNVRFEDDGGDPFPEDYEMARAAIAAMQGWQSIESAPRDGTEFLACYIGELGRWTRVAEYSGNPQSPWEDDEGMHPEGFFTHWMPLPPAPEVSRG